MDLKAQADLMQHARDFVNSTTDTLSTRLGRAPNEQELLIFSSAVASMTASFCYSKIHEAGGREPADTWMQQIFIQIGAAVQARGTPVTLQINLKSIPMADKKEPEASPLVQEQSSVTLCKCVTDQAGQCASCLADLRDSLSGIIDVSVSVEGFSAKKRCQPCVRKLFDAAFSAVIREKYPSVGGAVRDMITTMAIQMGSANGVTEIPQIEAALAEVQKI